MRGRSRGLQKESLKKNQKSASEAKSIRRKEGKETSKEMHLASPKEREERKKTNFGAKM